MRQKYINGMEKHAVRTLLILSFIPKIRFFSPVFAGLFKVKWSTFFIVNGVGTIIFITVYIAAGMLFHPGLEYLLKELEMLRHFIFAIFLVVITAAVFFKITGKQIG